MKFNSARETISSHGVYLDNCGASVVKNQFRSTTGQIDDFHYGFRALVTEYPA